MALAKAIGDKGVGVIPEFTKSSLNCEAVSDFPEMEGKGSLVKLLLRFVCQESRLFAVVDGGVEVRPPKTHTHAHTHTHTHTNTHTHVKTHTRIHTHT